MLILAGILYGIQQVRDGILHNLCPINGVCCFQQLMRLINNVVIAVQQHTMAGTILQPLGGQQQVMVCNLEVKLPGCGCLL